MKCKNCRIIKCLLSQTITIRVHDYIKKRLVLNAMMIHGDKSKYLTTYTNVKMNL